MNAPVVDQQERDRIAHELDTNFLVEAGAGSGKTTALVGRMVALVRSGVRVGDIAAVTFTRKAAGELRERFQTEIERAAHTAADPTDAARFEGALRDLDQGFIGTIHAFCGRLVREHAFDLGLTPALEEVDEQQWQQATADFWHRWVDRCHVDGHPELQALEALGVPAVNLLSAFTAVVGNPDVTFRADPVAAPDPAACRTRLLALLDQAESLMPSTEPDGGWDTLQTKVRQLSYRRRVDQLDTLPGLAHALELLGTPKVIQKCWGSSKEEKAAAKELCAAFVEFAEGDADQFLQQWWAHCYHPVMAWIAEAAAAFEADRLRQGFVGFTDLLFLAARLLRTSPDARASLGRKYQRLLVDEFQDTDPMQAEVCLLLTSDPSQGPDWRTVVPRPGSLFVVGDPKQSIYRFRRADLDTYRVVHERMQHFGEVLQLTQSFRASPAVADFVNAHFRATLTAAAPGQAEFAPFVPARTAAAGDGISRYSVAVDGGQAGHQRISSCESPGLAAWIAGAVERGEHQPEDFLVLTAGRASVRSIATELARWNVPVTATGAEVPDERELGDLRLLLRTLADPGNPVLVAAVLEGIFFGLTPADLFAASEAGVTFSLLAPATASIHPATEALKTLRQWLAIARASTPDVLLERVLADSGLLLYSATMELGDIRAGLLVRLVQAVRHSALQGTADLRSALQVIDAVLESRDTSATLRPGLAGAVRVMNLHQAKGLEAEVVVLGCPTDFSPHTPTLHVAREASGSVGYLDVCDGNTTVARPLDWNSYCEREEALLASEAERLRYVAATRARSQLVVAQLTGQMAKGVREDKSMWADFAPGLAGAPMIEMPAGTPPGREVMTATVAELQAAEAEAAARFADSTAASMARTTVTRSAKAEHEEEDTLFRGGGNAAGRAWGSAVHRAIEAMGRGRTGANLDSWLRAIVRSEGLGDTDAEVETAALRLGDTLARIRETPEWRELMAAPDRRFELAVMQTHKAADGVTTLVEGVVDAVAIGENGWTVFDWKSDAVDGAEWTRREPAYNAQVRLYREMLVALGETDAGGRVVRVNG